MPRKTKIGIHPRNPIRTVVALWRVLSDVEDADANVEEAAIVQFAFNRSRWGRRVARWDELANEVAADSAEARALMQKRTRLPVIDLDALLALPEGSLGHEFARYARLRGIDPNALEKLPAASDGDWLMAYSYETHDLWHLMTGFYYDLEGEFGVAGFYLGQNRKFSFIAFFTALLIIRTVWTDRDAIGPRLAALNEGYAMGSAARNLLGLDWGASFERDLDELRAEWQVRSAAKFPTLSAVA